MKTPTVTVLWLALSVMSSMVPSSLALKLPQMLSWPFSSASTTAISTTTPFAPFEVRFALDTTVDDIHTHFMKVALQEAAAAAVQGEVPIGAVVVRQLDRAWNQTTQTTIPSQAQQEREHQPEQQLPEQLVFQVLSVGRNAVEATHDASAHAELLALRAAAINQQPSNWRLNTNANVNGQQQHSTGQQQHTATTTTLYSTLEPCPMCLTAAQAFRVSHIVYGANDDRLGAVETHMRLLDDYQHPFHNITTVTAGVQAQASSDMLRAFFRQRRLEAKQRRKHEKEQQGGGKGEVTAATQHQERRHWLSWRRLLRHKRIPPK
jgi:tRNA(adenine34) deaminase